METWVKWTNEWTMSGECVIHVYRGVNELICDMIMLGDQTMTRKRKGCVLYKEIYMHNGG